MDWLSGIWHWVINLPAWVWIAIAAHLLVLGTVAYLILLERKVASWVQDRLGPNRVGLGFGIIPWLKDKKMWGLGQPLADGLKFIVKEDYHARNVDKVLFTLAPAMMIIVVIISIAVLPIGGTRVLVKDVVIGSDAQKPLTDYTPAEIAARVKETLPAGARIDEKLSGEVQKVGVLKDDQVEPAAQGEPSHRYLVERVVYNAYRFQIADLNIGVLFILAVLSLEVYGVVIGGWASNNKYSFLGGLRATVNMISYEIPLGLAVLCIVIMFGTLDLERIVDQQAHYWAGWIPAWNVFSQPLAFVMFLVCIHAEANRAPFDLAEAEQELVGGYHTEYSSMRFALFFLAEYAGMMTTSAVCVALFFGGWHFPGVDHAVVTIVNALTHSGAWVDPAHPAVTNSLTVCLIRAAVVFIKTLVVIFVFMWVRWSLPRFRFDQLMMLAWRALIPISLALLVMTSIIVYVWSPAQESLWSVNGQAALIFLAGNVVVLAGSMALSRVLPPPPQTNRKVPVPGSRFTSTPIPAAAYN